MTTTVNPATVCHDWCVSTHDNLPDDSFHESPPVQIPQAPTEQFATPVTMYVADDVYRPVLLLHVGAYTFDPVGAEQLYAELGLQLQRMRFAQASADAGILLDGAR